MTPEEAEFYPTPAWCVRRLWDVVGGWYRGTVLFDPCVGEGAIPEAIGLAEGHWAMADIRPTDYLREHGGLHVDYLRTGGSEPRANLCIMNPPFSKALEFARRARAHCDAVYMLQRLSWMQSPERAEWLRENPFDLYVLPERPSFTGDGKTDSGGYGWYRWPSVGEGVRMLASTSKAERQLDEIPVLRRQQEMF